MQRLEFKGAENHMLHITVELSQCSADVRNEEEVIVFRGAEQELLRLSFSEFDQLLEAVAWIESFTPGHQ
jgi:hypothetical protein